MNTTVQVKIYYVKPVGFKPTSIQVKELKQNLFYCRFLDPEPINEFRVTGFCVEYLNDHEQYLISGDLTLVYAESIWEEYLRKQNNPDIQFTFTK